MLDKECFERTYINSSSFDRIEEYFVHFKKLLNHNYLARKLLGNLSKKKY